MASARSTDSEWVVAWRAAASGWYQTWRSSPRVLFSSDHLADLDGERFALELSGRYAQIGGLLKR